MTSLTYNAIQRACKILDVVVVQSGHGYTPIQSQINVVLFYEPLTLLIADPRETQVHLVSFSVFHIKIETIPEHADLINNVIPVTRSMELFCQKSVQFLSHLNYSTRHRLDVFFPFFE